MFKLDRKKFDLARADKCYNLTDVAKNAHICYSTLTKLLNGSINLSAKTLGKIAKALDVKPKDLIKDE
ncbi:helix-turn-helix transcriptional regulator [Megamonas hypermegale]|uniref:helix-turn-helix domain-containing protein n=1 Tax=Megamonas hypermegale TaxID=158847 RepID=UPI003208755E